jgi:glycogen(starch) synthase
VFVVQQASALRQAGHEVAVIHLDALPSPRVPAKQADTIARVFAAADAVAYPVPGLDAGVQVVRVPFMSGDAVGFQARAVTAREQLDRCWTHLNDDAGGFDILHAHVTMPAGYAAIGRGVPVVATEHFTGVDRVLAQAAAREAFLEVVESSRVLCVSGFLRNNITRALGGEQPELGVVPNMVDFTDLDYVPRQTLGQRWVYVGSLTARKNVDLLVRSFAHFRATNPEATLTIVGGGELQDDLAATADRLGVAEDVAFLGSQSRAQAAAEIRRADLLCHLSSLETFGLTCVEAIASGAPVVSLANGGAESSWGAIEHSCGRILSPYLDEVAIATEVERLADRSDALDLETASQWVREQYAPSVISARLTEIYEELTS